MASPEVSPDVVFLRALLVLGVPPFPLLPTVLKQCCKEATPWGR